MVRTTTPTHYFKFPIDPDTHFSEIQITYRQDDEIKLVKDKTDLTFYNAGTEAEPIYMGKYRLTQEETALFRGNMPGDTQAKRHVYIQVKVQKNEEGGDVLASKPFRVSVWDVLNSDLLG